MKLKKIFLLSLLVLLLLSVSYATETNNDTISTIDAPEVVKDTSTTANIVDNNINETKMDKEITKQANTNKTTKRLSNSYDVNDFNSLHDALTNDEYDRVTVNINSNIKLRGNTTLNEAIKTLTINGNGKTINGNNKYQFLEIDENCTVTINDIKIINCTSDNYGGAIRNHGNITVINSTFTHNIAPHGGAIYCDQKVILKDSIFSENIALARYGAGGAIFTKYIEVINSSFIKNIANERGGAIYCDQKGILKDSIFSENIALLIYGEGSIYTDYTNVPSPRYGYAHAAGGAIYAKYIEVINSSFIKNTANTHGGAISGTSLIIDSIFSENTALQGGAVGAIVEVINSSFINNTAVVVGGALWDDVSIKVTKSNFINNTGGDGGAIFGFKYINVTNSSFINNTGDAGGAITTDMRSNITVISNYFAGNIASYDGETLALRYGTRIVNNNIYDSTDIALKTLNLTIKDNQEDFKVGEDVKLKFNIEIEHPEYYDTDILEKLNKTLYINNKNITTNNKNYILTNLEAGEYTVKYSINRNTSNSINFVVNKDSTIITVDTSTTRCVGNQMSISGKLTNLNGKSLANQQVMIIFDGKRYNTNTTKYGKYNLKLTPTTTGIKTITVVYNGNSQYSESSNNMTITVQQPTMIKYANIANVKIGTTVKIVGRLVSNVTGQAIKYASVTVKVNDETYKLKTNGAGYVSLNYTVKDYNVQKITFKYNGNSINLASSNNTTFKVKQPTWIKMANMGNVKCGSTVKLVGRLLNGSNAVKYVPVNITVNGKTYKVKTDGAGYFRLNYTVNSYDDQKISFKFVGNSLYLASSNSTTFKVKQPTWIKHASITKVKQGSTVKIVGRLLYNGTNSVKYVPVNVTVNGKVYKLKTDGAGYYRLNYTATTLGTITFTSNFGGNNLYLASTNSTKFTVVKSSQVCTCNCNCNCKTV